MENQPAGLVFPFSAVCALPPFQLPQSGQRSWNPFPSERIPLPCPFCTPSVSAAAVRATLMESVPAERIPLPCPSCAPSVSTTAVKATDNGKDRPEGRSFHERPLAARDCASCGMRFYFLFGLKPGSDTGFQRGVPDSAESGQPARLDRAGSQTRTRLSPAGGIGASKSLGGIPYPLTVPFSTWNTVPAWNRAAVSSSQQVIIT